MARLSLSHRVHTRRIRQPFHPHIANEPPLSMLRQLALTTPGVSWVLVPLYGPWLRRCGSHGTMKSHGMLWGAVLQYCALSVNVGGGLMVEGPEQSGNVGAGKSIVGPRAGGVRARWATALGGSRLDGITALERSSTPIQS